MRLGSCSREMDPDAAYAIQRKHYVQKQTKIRPSEHALDVSLHWCYYHSTFDDTVHQCRQPYNWPRKRQGQAPTVVSALCTTGSLSSLILLPNVNFLLIREQKLASYLHPVETQGLRQQGPPPLQPTVTRYERMALVNSLSTSIPAPMSGTSQWQM